MVFSGVVNWVGEWYRRFSWRLIFKSDFTPSTLVSMASDNELMSNLLISQMYWLSNVAFHAYFVKNDRAWFQNEPAYCKCIWKVVTQCSFLTQKWWNFQFYPWGRGGGLIRNFAFSLPLFRAVNSACRAELSLILRSTQTSQVVRGPSENQARQN